jgi:hypothetical protein
MYIERNLVKYLRNALGPLEPIVRHSLKGVYAAMFVRFTSLSLHFILPEFYLEAIEKLELQFYIALSAVLCGYAFILLCLNLTAHLIEEFVHARIKLSKRLSELEEESEVSGYLLPNDSQDQFTSVNSRAKARRRIK